MAADTLTVGIMNEQTGLSEEDRRRIQELREIVRLFQEKNENMPVQVLNVFLTVALNEGKSMREMMQYADIDSQSTISRHLIDLGPRNRYKKEGYKLVQQKIDPMEMRKKQYTLTSRGRKLLSTVLDHLKRTP